jgi:hypothetical protein
LGVQAKVKVIDGQLHRLCFGPSHREPTWLPLTEKYFYPRVRPNGHQYFRTRCRLCELWKWGGDTAHGLVPAASVSHYFTEGINKVGKVEFARRIGIAHDNLNRIVDGRRKNVRKETVRRCLLEVISIRRKGEVRHRDSISRGVNLRGEPEKEVKFLHDLSPAEQSHRRRSEMV